MLKTLRCLHEKPLLRRLFLPLLKRFNPGNIQLRHHYTHGTITLHSYRHKGYWFHGRTREQQTMEFFQKVIHPGDCVIEIGGHIGYMSMYFAGLVGRNGKVVVFEPGSNNLPYARENLEQLTQVELIEKAVSNGNGVAQFFEEELTGQNNSLNADYAVFDQNCQRAYSNTQYLQREVETVRLDTFLPSRGLEPKLLKIDIEGAELLALHGSQNTFLEFYPIVMVEVTSHKLQVFEFFDDLGYQLFSDVGEPLVTPDQLDFNVCALHPEFHGEIISELGWKVSQAA